MRTTTTPNTTSQRTAVYARVSTLGHGQDVGLQLDELRQVAKQRGWNVDAEHVDDGVSGAATSRPALDEMMTQTRRGQIDLIAVWRFDRFARRTRHLLAALDEFRPLGVNLISVRNAIDASTSLGKTVFLPIAAVAEMEKAVLVERVIAGVRRVQAHGKHCGRPRVTLDVLPALALFGQGHSEREIASMLGVSRATLRRRLAEHGVAQKPVVEAA
jgi:DNA invertase Pin-like site-specific DNA recombinase